MNGMSKEASASVGSPSLIWEIATLGDYNGGGQADILWRGTASGATLIWEMNGLVKVGAHQLLTLTAWTVH